MNTQRHFLFNILCIKYYMLLCNIKSPFSFPKDCKVRQWQMADNQNQGASTNGSQNNHSLIVKPNENNQKTILYLKAEKITQTGKKLLNCSKISYICESYHFVRSLLPPHSREDKATETDPRSKKRPPQAHRDFVCNFNNNINHIVIKIMTLSFRLGLEGALCQGSRGAICMGNHDRERTPRSSFLLTTCCFPNTGQTLAAHAARIKRGHSHCSFQGAQKLTSTKLHFCSKDSLSEQKLKISSGKKKFILNNYVVLPFLSFIK